MGIREEIFAAAIEDARLVQGILIAEKGEARIIPEEKANREVINHPAAIHPAKRDHQADPAAKVLTATAEAIPATGEVTVPEEDLDDY